MHVETFLSSTTRNVTCNLSGKGHNTNLLQHNYRVFQQSCTLHATRPFTWWWLHVPHPPAALFA